MSATVSSHPQPSPEPIFETLNAFQRSAALKAAIELDIFTAIAERANTAPALAKECGAAERGVRILCDFLVIHGLLTKDDSHYGLTPESATFLNRRSPAYMGSIANFLTAPDVLDAYKELTASVRNGGSVVKESALAPEHPVWVEFARSMAPMMAMPARALAELLSARAGHKWKVLGIAAGHALFGINILQQNPNAELTVVDWPNVVQVARENAQKAGVVNRFHALPGSAFDVDYGSGYDLVLLMNFLHHFDPPTNEKLLRKVHAALKDGGRAVALEFVPNEDRVSPRMAASFSMIMLGTTPAGDAYTFPEFERMFRNAGFQRCEKQLVPPGVEHAVIGHK
jgi:SAM-dependent methyltransferase